MLIRAAGQFVVRPGGMRCTSVGGYPWLEPMPRIQLISFAGMFLVTGRFDDARDVLLDMSSMVEGGLLKNEAADVSLWFINAIWNYHRYANDAETTRKLLDVAMSIITAFRAGTAAGVSVSDDGLLGYRVDGIAATWMNGKVGDHVITLRRGMAVETNALWFNAVSIVAELAEHLGRSDSATLRQYGLTVSDSFNQQFWNPEAGCCFDVIDGESKDASIRPNQLLAASLPFAVLDPSRIPAMLKLSGASC